MITLNLTEEELQIVSKALTDFYYRQPINPLDEDLRRFEENIKALADKHSNTGKKTA